ncbi:MAG: hypothetical protein OEL83_14730 [Desulforhopalus sp.]|nr:hypothetical protein [Desulforhopalus sp.]
MLNIFGNIKAWGRVGWARLARFWPVGQDLANHFAAASAGTCTCCAMRLLIVLTCTVAVLPAQPAA